MESVKIQLEELFSGLQVPPTFPPDNRDVPGNDSRETTREPHTRDELRYRTLIENLPIGIYRVTPGPQARLLMANQAFLDMFGVDRQEALGPLTECDDEVSSDHSILGEVAESDLQLRKKDGTPIWCSLMTRAVRKPSGEVAYYDCVIKDITEPRRAERSVWEADLWARRALDALQDTVLVITQDRAIVNANAAAQEMFGYTLAELVCLSPEVLYVDHYAEMGRVIQALGDKEEEAHLTVEARRKNGQTFLADHMLHVMRNDESRPAAVLCVIREIQRPAPAGESRSVQPLTTGSLTRACVYLGLYDDPNTHHSYACNANYCHAQSPPLAIEPPYQSSTCLTSNWGTCPYFKAALMRNK